MTITEMKLLCFTNIVAAYEALLKIQSLEIASLQAELEKKSEVEGGGGDERIETKRNREN